MFRRGAIILLGGAILAFVGLWISLTLTFKGPEYFAPMPTFREIADEPVVLVGGLRSYARLAEVERVLAEAGEDLRIIQDEEWAELGVSVRYVVARVDRFRDRGHSGSLTLAFLNDRLATATFEPEDWEAYRAAIKGVELSEEGQLIASGSIGENVVVHLLRPRRSVTYADRRLDRELAIFLAKTGD